MTDLFAAGRDEGRVGVLFVCTGNICRSPLAEAVFRARSGGGVDGAGLPVGSAGLHAVVGAPMDGIPAQLARDAGADSQHRARQIDRDSVSRAALVLTMTREQRTQLVREFPSALRRAFTLAEFLRLLGDPAAPVRPEAPAAPVGLAASQRLGELVAGAGSARGSLGSHDDDDIADPYGRSRETHERVGGRIVALVDELARRLGTL
ncbi:low molecular weight phosphatase family protein [Compostimonas suwonensis]|uniref:Protein-tyrosine phosphatase n=1 Tax=Compostimonas suwonensis TaxID=1048394 RepID=A0A2M9C575_9MICO|nr:low molecular weight phosphatase family protein [Compostimonas suwonensis]PJJ65649.1 protein-tyrosine phosphatase [Compostimonas suwonensis]